MNTFYEFYIYDLKCSIEEYSVSQPIVGTT